MMYVTYDTGNLCYGNALQISNVDNVRHNVWYK